MKPYYERDGITIYHGDARRLLPSLPRFDLLCTDPPYGLGAGRPQFHNRAGCRTPADWQRKLKKYGNTRWDDAPVADDLLALARARTRWQVVFGGNYFNLPPARCVLVWIKQPEVNWGRVSYADAELAWTNLRKPVRVIRWRWAGFLQEDMRHKEQRVHPTQKPLPVMRWCIEQAPTDCLSVLDPFMGSGTTLVAAAQLGRQAVGIDLYKRYCRLAADRVEQALGEAKVVG